MPVAMIVPLSPLIREPASNGAASKPQPPNSRIAIPAIAPPAAPMPKSLNADPMLLAVGTPIDFCSDIIPLLLSVTATVLFTIQCKTDLRNCPVATNRRDLASNQGPYSGEGAEALALRPKFTAVLGRR